MEIRQQPAPRPLSYDPAFLKKQKENEKAESLGKVKIIADIFNNNPEEKNPPKNVKVNLSFTVRALAQELTMQLKNFLQKEKEIKKLAEAIDLPDNSYLDMSKDSDLTLRKMSSYYQWMTIRRHLPVDHPTVEEEAPFLAIHQQGKDEEIKKIFVDFEEKHMRILNERKKSAPNYYYLAYPEAYSFN